MNIFNSNCLIWFIHNIQLFNATSVRFNIHAKLMLGLVLMSLSSTLVVCCFFFTHLKKTNLNWIETQQKYLNIQQQEHTNWKKWAYSCGIIKIHIHHWYTLLQWKQLNRIIFTPIKNDMLKLENDLNLEKQSMPSNCVVIMWYRLTFKIFMVASAFVFNLRQYRKRWFIAVRL